MPIAKVPCAKVVGHKGVHQSRASLDVKSKAGRDERAVPGGYSAHREWSRAKRAERRAFLDAYKVEKGCTDCGYNDHPFALEFDHLPGADKVAPVSNMILADMDRLMAEIAKCEIVCANCHRIRTTEREQWKSMGPNKNRSNAA